MRSKWIWHPNGTRSDKISLRGTISWFPARPDIHPRIGTPNAKCGSHQITIMRNKEVFCQSLGAKARLLPIREHRHKSRKRTTYNAFLIMNIINSPNSPCSALLSGRERLVRSHCRQTSYECDSCGNCRPFRRRICLTRDLPSSRIRGNLRFPQVCLEAKHQRPGGPAILVKIRLQEWWSDKTQFHGLQPQETLDWWLQWVQVGMAYNKSGPKKQQNETLAIAAICLILGYLVCWFIQVPPKPKVNVPQQFVWISKDLQSVYMRAPW